MRSRIGWRQALAAAVACGGLAGAAMADIIELQDGRKLMGTMRRDGEMVVITGEDGKTTRVGSIAVIKVTLQSNTPPADMAVAEWTRASTMLAKANTLEAVIDVHKKFLAKYPNEPVSADVKKALAHYESLVGQDVVKYRGRWLTRDMIRDQERAWETEAGPALERYKAGQLADARQAAMESIAADPDNPTTLALAGLASYRLNELPKAKTYFTKLAAVDPGSVLAENNLGVISFQQRAQPEGLLHYAKAIQAKPDNRLVLDNAADAMGAFLGSKDIDAYRNLARQYGQAETAMEADMAKRGLYRFGSTWLPKEQRDKYGADRQQILTAMSQLDAKFSIARQKLDLLDQQLKQVSADYDQTAANLGSLNISAVGTTRGNYNGTNYDYQRGIMTANLDALARRKAELQVQCDQANQELQPFFAEATRLKAALAAVPEVAYTVLQRLMELGDVDDPPAPAPLTVKGAAAPAPTAAPVVATPPAPAPAAPGYPMPTNPGYDPGGGFGVGFSGGGGGAPVTPSPGPTPAPPPTPKPSPAPSPVAIPPDRDSPATRPSGSPPPMRAF